MHERGLGTVGIKVGIVGVGNIASMLVQSVFYYKRLETSEGLIHEDIGGFKVTDIEFSYAVDVSRDKVGKDLSEAIFAYPNVVPKIAEVPKLGVEVRLGRVLDGVALHMEEDFRPLKAPEPTVHEVAKDIEDSGTEVLVNLLPVGSEEATHFYAEAAARAGVAFINAIPVFVASQPSELLKLFEEKRAPILGDDIKGQLGSTIVHRALASLIRMRGARLLETYQLNVGGNTDFKNMLVLDRLSSKKVSKTMAVASTQEEPQVLLKEGKVFAGPSGFVPFLGNTKISYMYMRAKAFAGLDVEIEVKLKVDDKAMATAVLVDVIRIAKVLRDIGIGGSVAWASAFYFKHPPLHTKSDYDSLKMLYEGLESLGVSVRPKMLEYY